MLRTIKDFFNGKTLVELCIIATPIFVAGALFLGTVRETGAVQGGYPKLWKQELYVDCIDGVEYLIGHKKMTVKYTTDGKVSTCEVW